MVDKIFLKEHMYKREELQDEIKRYELIMNSNLPQGIKMDGMPHGSQGTADSIFYNTMEKLETEKKIKDLRVRIEEEYGIINAVIEQLVYPAEKKIMKMRYFNCMDWSDIREAEYAKMRDYHENMEKYKDKIFKIHGSALRHMKEIQEGENAG